MVHNTTNVRIDFCCQALGLRKIRLLPRQKLFLLFFLSSGLLWNAIFALEIRNFFEKCLEIIAHRTSTETHGSYIFISPIFLAVQFILHWFLTITVQNPITACLILFYLWSLHEVSSVQMFANKLTVEFYNRPITIQLILNWHLIVKSC